ncbi:MAG TPA: hypothetical protein VLJ37_05150 [bacterium]|nr:hypothetical protein [bacterium]
MSHVPSTTHTTGPTLSHGGPSSIAGGMEIAKDAARVSGGPNPLAADPTQSLAAQYA